MSTEHGTAVPEIRPAVMAALLKHAAAVAAGYFLRREMDYYNQHYVQALNELKALGVLDEAGHFNLTLTEDSALNAFYDEEVKRLRATYFQTQEAAE